MSLQKGHANCIKEIGWLKMDLVIIKSMIQKDFGVIHVNGWGLAFSRMMNASHLLPPFSWELGLSHICAYCNIPIITTHYKRWQALLSSLSALWEWIFIHLSLCILINKVVTCLELTQMPWNIFVWWILDIKWTTWNKSKEVKKVFWAYYYKSCICKIEFESCNKYYFVSFYISHIYLSTSY